MILTVCRNPQSIFERINTVHIKAEIEGVDEGECELESQELLEILSQMRLKVEIMNLQFI